MTCVEIKILRSPFTPSMRRLLDGVTMPVVTTRRSQHGRIIAENDLVNNCRVHPTNRFISTQVMTYNLDSHLPMRRRHPALERVRVLRGERSPDGAEEEFHSRVVI